MYSMLTLVVVTCDWPSYVSFSFKDRCGYSFAFLGVGWVDAWVSAESFVRARTRESSAETSEEP